MANDFPGPLSPEQLEQAQGYYSVAPVASVAPPPDASAYYSAAPPVASVQPPVRPVGAQLSQVGDPQAAPFSGSAPPTPASVPPASTAAAYFGADKLDAADVVAGSPDFGGKSAAQIRAQALAGPSKSAPPIPQGPDAAADREYAAFRRLQDTKPGHAATGGSGKANPDPYGTKAATNALLGTYDTEKTAIEHAATAEGDRASLIGDRRADLARQQQEDAAIRAAEVTEAQEKFDSHMTEVQRQLDDVRAQKVDPGRLMSQDGMGIKAVIGGLLGGLYMGLNKLDKNPFLEDLNRQIDRDIAVQEKNIDNAQRGANDRMNLLREQRATFKDNDLAKLQARNAMYEASRNAIEAEASKFDQPIVKARAEQALAGVNREQAGLQKQIAERAQAVAQAQAAAQAAQARAQQTEMRKAFGDTYEKNIAAGMSPATAETEANRMVSNLFGGGAGARPAPAAGARLDPVSQVPKDQRTQALKEQEEYGKAESAIKNIDDAFARFKKTGITSPRQLEAIKAGIAGAYKSGLGPGMSSDKDFETFIEPNIPATTDTSETLAVKQRNIAASIRSKIATPTLDTHAPGWRGPAPVKEFNLDGTPKG